MSEVRDLVSWNEAEELGKIEGTDWVCPVGSIDTLGDVHRLGGEITDEDITVLANGRDQHLAVTQFPEGYKAVKIINSETGAVLTDYDAAYRYFGLYSCACGNSCGAAVASVMTGRRLPLDDDHELSNLTNPAQGTQSLISPIAVSPDDLDAARRERTYAQITPQGRELYIRTGGNLGAFERSGVDLDIRQSNDRVGAELSLSVMDEIANVIGQVTMDLDQAGAVSKLMVYRAGWLEAIGMQVSSDFEFDLRTGWGKAVNERTQTRVLDATAEALGFGASWTGLDLKMTAAGLYAAMSKRDLQVSSVLVPNC